MRHPLLACSLLALAACSTAREFTPPRIVGDELRPIAFHARLGTAPAPLEPRPADPADCATAPDGAIRVDVQVLSVPRGMVRDLLGVKLAPQQRAVGPKTRSENASALAPVPEPRPVPTSADVGASGLHFLWEGTMPVQWWGPRSMRVPAADAHAAFAQLRAEVQAERRRTRGSDAAAHELSFACDAGARARVAVVDETAIVDSIRFEDDRNRLAWEPIIATAESGFSMTFEPRLDGDTLTADFELLVRDVVGVPLARGQIAASYLHASQPATQPITLQAPLYSDHVFAGSCTCRDGDALVVFATNTAVADYVLVALIATRRQPASVAAR